MTLNTEARTHWATYSIGALNSGQYYCSVPGWSDYRTTDYDGMLRFILERFDVIFADQLDHFIAVEAALPKRVVKTPAKRSSIPLGRGWSVALRRDEVVPSDPGAGTPAMVCGPFGKQATYWCALDNGEVEDRWGDVTDIPAHVMRAIDKAQGQVAAYIEEVTSWLAR